ncbi:MAG: SDR family NAD(P)-dependent oxidoreductase, partial [Methylococcaceae bacterium]
MTHTVLITGANRGLGLEMAKQYAKAHWNVHACCRNPDSATMLLELVQEFPDKINIHPLVVLNFM